MTTLYVREDSQFREADTNTILSTADALISMKFRRGTQVLSDAIKVRQYLRLHLGSLDYEVFGLLHLNLRHKLIAAE
jgi:DNA repair protein RadC